MVYTRYLSCKKGYSLIESLIVLMVISVFLCFGTITLSPMMHWLQKQMFISQLQSDLYQAHSYALNRRERVIITFSRAPGEYSAANESNKVLFKRDYPPPVKQTGGTLTRFHITPDGNISHFGKVNFQLDEKEIELTVYIGRGRFVVKE